MKISRLARQANRKHQDIDAAVAWAMSWLRKNNAEARGLRDKAILELVECGMRGKIDDDRHSTIRYLKFADPNPTERRMNVLSVRVGDRIKHFLKSWPTKDGRTLFDHNRPELLGWVEKERLIRNGHNANILFGEALAERASASAPVGKNVSHAESMKMWLCALREAGVPQETRRRV
jgi:hypothetical protein